MTTSTKLNPKLALGKKVMIRAINEALRQNMCGLKPGENYWGDHPTLEFVLDGTTALISVHDIGYDELSIKVIYAPSDFGRSSVHVIQSFSGTERKMGGFYVTSFLIRRDTAKLQVTHGLMSVSCAKARKDEIEAIRWEEPLGYWTDDRS